jgi:hypothetical protein
MVAASPPLLVGPQPSFGWLLVAGNLAAVCCCGLGALEHRSPQVIAEDGVLGCQPVVDVEEPGLDLLAGLVWDLNVVVTSGGNMGS